MNRIADWLRQAEAFLDRHGRGAWIAAFVVGFIVAWPVGLAILLYTLWSGRMGKGWGSRCRRARGATGNTAFDEYREETLRRLEDERTAFEDFLDRLRRARDRAEFEQFMGERRDGRSPEPNAG